MTENFAIQPPSPPFHSQIQCWHLALCRWPITFCHLGPFSLFIYFFHFHAFTFLVLFIYGCAGYSLLPSGFSNCREGGLPFTNVVGSSWRWLLLRWCTGSSVVVTTALFALQQVESSQTRDGTHIPCWQADSQPLDHQGSPHLFQLSCLLIFTILDYFNFHLMVNFQIPHFSSEPHQQPSLVLASCVSLFNSNESTPVTVAGKASASSSLYS